MSHHLAVERRHHARIETALPVRCQSSSYVDEAAIALDISLTGAQILVNKNHCFEGPIELEIELDRQSRLLLRANAVWTTPIDEYNALLGVRFGQLGTDHNCLYEWFEENFRFAQLLHNYCAGFAAETNFRALP